MFPGFRDEMMDVGGLRLRTRFGGEGPAVLLIHGHPRTSATWHDVAVRLVRAGFTVVCPDMRGYGKSEKAPVRQDHSQQSKRVVANDFACLMKNLGHDRFLVVGHDRGCYVGMRLALDFPQNVRGFMPLDAVPLSDALDLCNAQFAQEWFHWFFFAQPEKPERAINADPLAWYGVAESDMSAENYAEFREAVSDPSTVLAMLEDYRAGIYIDDADEKADREAGRKLECPVFFLWGEDSDIGDLYPDPVAVWRNWSDNVEGRTIKSGHHIAETASAPLADAIVSFHSRCPI